MHWHGYLWTGNGADRGNEAERRPTSPDFVTSPLPPMRTGDWLAKPASRIAETFEDAEAAVKWLEIQYDSVKGVMLHPDRIPLADRLVGAADQLPRQVDVQWGEWLQGGRFATIAMICCPNRDVPRTCPLKGR